MNITIQKIGNLPVPIYLEVFYKDDSKEIINKTAEVWKNGNASYTINHTSKKKIKKLVLGNKIIPDVNKKNNTYID